MGHDIPQRRPEDIFLLLRELLCVFLIPLFFFFFFCVLCVGKNTKDTVVVVVVYTILLVAQGPKMFPVTGGPLFFGSVRISASDLLRKNSFSEWSACTSYLIFFFSFLAGNLTLHTQRDF